MAKPLTNINSCKGYRVRAGIERPEMCRLLNVGSTRYHRLENALSEFTPREMLVYARACHLSMREFGEVFFNCELPIDSAKF